MSEDTLTKIIKICLAIDQRAADIYVGFSSVSGSPELKQFWEDMAQEEKEHVELWEKLLAMAEESMLPQVFDDPDRVLTELAEVRDKVDLLAEQGHSNPTVSSMFVLAYRTEFYVMQHPAFGTLFHFLQTVSEEKDLEERYDTHISRFADGFARYGEVTPELELLSETLRHLWQDNRLLARQSTTDELTGVLNRRGFFNAMKPLAHLARRQGAAVGILMVDIDDFKQINDTLGHQKGDEALRMMGDILRARMRASDLVGRYGGEEFIVFLPLIKKASLQRIAEEIRKRVASETQEQTPITVSIGAAEGLLEGDVDGEVMALIKKADACLYEAKRRGKNIVVMDEG